MGKPVTAGGGCGTVVETFDNLRLRVGVQIKRVYRGSKRRKTVSVSNGRIFSNII